MPASATVRAAAASPWYASAMDSISSAFARRSTVVVGLGFGHHLAELRDRCRSDRPRIICAPASRHRHCRDPKRSPMASARSRPSWPAAAAPMGSPGDESRMGLLAENLAQPPPVSDCPGETDRLGEVSPGHFGVVDGGAAAGDERSDEQGGIVEFARDRQGLLGVLRAVDGDPRIEHGLVGQRPRAYRGRHVYRVARCRRRILRRTTPALPGCGRGTATAAAVPTPAPTPARHRRFPGSTPNAPRRLSISSRPARRAARSQCGPARRAAPPSRCSGRGGATAPRRPLRTRRASPARIGARSRATGIAFGHWCFRRSPATCRRAGRADRGPGSAPLRRHRRRLGRRRGRIRRGTPPAGGTACARFR